MNLIKIGYTSKLSKLKIFIDLNAIIKSAVILNIYLGSEIFWKFNKIFFKLWINVIFTHNQ